MCYNTETGLTQGSTGYLYQLLVILKNVNTFGLRNSTDKAYLQMLQS